MNKTLEKVFKRGEFTRKDIRYKVYTVIGTDLLVRRRSDYDGYACGDYYLVPVKEVASCKVNISLRVCGFIERKLVTKFGYAFLIERYDCFTIVDLADKLYYLDSDFELTAEGLLSCFPDVIYNKGLHFDHLTLRVKDVDYNTGKALVGIANECTGGKYNCTTTLDAIDRMSSLGLAKSHKAFYPTRQFVGWDVVAYDITDNGIVYYEMTKKGLDAGVKHRECMPFDMFMSASSATFSGWYTNVKPKSTDSDYVQETSLEQIFDAFRDMRVSQYWG